MKYRSVLLLALLIVPTALRAQEGASATTGIVPRSRAGDFALLFDLGGLAQLALNGFNGSGADTSSVGAGFGAKYFIADNVALRLGLSFASNNATLPVDSIVSDELGVVRFGIAPGVIVNIARTGSVAGYVGGTVSYAMSTADRTPASDVEPKVEAKSSAFAIAGIIGAEWFPWSSVSLSGEYQLGYGTSSSEETRTVPGQDPKRYELPTESSFGVASRGVVTAAIYW